MDDQANLGSFLDEFANMGKDGFKLKDVASHMKSHEDKESESQ